MRDRTEKLAMIKMNEAQKVYFPAVDEEEWPLAVTRDQTGMRHYLEMWRVKVLGGWLLMETGQSSLHKPGVGGVTFLADPEHRWEAITSRDVARSLG